MNRVQTVAKTLDVCIVCIKQCILHPNSNLLATLPLAELPAKKIPGGLELTIDTAAIPGGPSLYFELSR